MHYKIHKVSLNFGSAYIYSPELLNNKKATINPKKNDLYALTVALNYQNIN